MSQLFCPRLQHTVLTGTVLHVQITVPVEITELNTVDGSVRHGQPFMDTSHQIRCLMNGLVRMQRLVEEIPCGIVIAQGPVTGSQRTVGTGNLIDIAIAAEEDMRLLREVSRNE